MTSTISSESIFEQTDSRNSLIVDVRSEAEFAKGHIPSAVNMPLLDNNERVIIGTTYVKDGRNAAVERGFELAAHKFSAFVKTAREMAGTRPLIIYCWRGGLRSRIVSWVLDLAGFKISVVKGGYKSFRQAVIKLFDERKSILILGGKTCSGKSEILNILRKKGQQTIDLEGIANHKGSVFGGLGKFEQPTQEQFENLLALQWRSIKNNEWLWLENESRLIGHVRIPDAMYLQMRNAPVVELCRQQDIRLQRVLNEYGGFETELLAQKTIKLQKRLGGLRLKQALDFLHNKEINKWALLMLDYYDKAYNHSNTGRDAALSRLYSYDENESPEQNADALIQAAIHVSKIISTDKRNYAEYQINKL